MTTPDPVLAAKVARAELVKRILIVVTTVLVTAVLVFQVVLLNSVRKTQLEGTPTGQKLLASSDRVLDCTSPDGECFKEGQKRTAEAVANINRVIVAAAACASGPVERSVDQIAACVTRRLAEPAP